MLDNIPVITSSTLSLFGQMVIVILFVSFEKLRQGLIPRIILFLTISGIIQTLGILCSSLVEPNCTIFATFRLYGGLSSLCWSAVLIYSIKQLFMVLRDDNEFKDIRDILDQLCEQENKFILYSYGIPFCLMIYPLITALTIVDKNQQYCMYYHTNQDTKSVIAQLDIQKLLFWIFPIILYLGYSLTIIKKIRELLAEDQEKQELYRDVKKMIKQIFLFPIITFICTFSFTVEDIQSLFVHNVNIVVKVDRLNIDDHIFGISQLLGSPQLFSVFELGCCQKPDLTMVGQEKEELGEFQISQNLLADEDAGTRLSIGSQCYYYDERDKSCDKSVQMTEHL